MIYNFLGFILKQDAYTERFSGGQPRMYKITFRAERLGNNIAKSGDKKCQKTVK